MIALVLAHAVAAMLAPLLLRALGRRALLVIALAPLATLVWALAQTGAVLDGRQLVQTTSWVPALGMDLSFALGSLQWVMTLVVAGIGVLVLVYCTWYFGDDSPLVGFATSLTAFMGAMLGLVLTDNLLLLYVFWELTTVFSFLLIGHDPTSRSSRLAALQALVVTAMGGLTMLVGMLVVGQQAGTYRITELLADPPVSTATTVGVLLILVGALTKSAQVPFQFWLPGAMAAPTPISAYLHAASMVKAGVYLIALLAPAFATVAGWQPLLLVLGSATMVYGGWRALRQNDLKLLLAYGTVSQLGFLTAVLAIGSRTAALAGVAMLLSHALFKAALFLIVGIVDKATGTRDLWHLSGLGRRMPLVAVAGALAAASMAGVPPLLGFVSKETIWAGLLEITAGDVDGLAPAAGWAVLAALTVGSALTAAYTARWWWGAFATKSGVEATEVAAPSAGLVVPPVLLAGLSLVVAFLGAGLTALIAGYSDTLPAHGHDEYLALWHGLELPLLVSGVSLAVGGVLFYLRDPLCRLQVRTHVPVSAEDGYRRIMRSVDRGAVELTGVVQRGSLTVYLVIILAVVLVVPGVVIAATSLRDSDAPLQVQLWDTPGQLGVAVVMIAGAIAAVRARRRLRAVLLAGVTGYGCALLFVMHGAPDIALTQALVETVSVVVFVLALRRLPDYFTSRAARPGQVVRVALAAGAGLAVGGFLLLAGSSRTSVPISAAFPERAREFGYGDNVVNVTLVDIRAWDTFGEISVLVAAATGVASLIFVGSRSTAIRRARDVPTDVAPHTSQIVLPSEEHAGGGRLAAPTATVSEEGRGLARGPDASEERPRPQGRRPGRQIWLPGSRTMAPERRSVVLEVIARMIFHPILVFSVYLLIAGHNLPGGGFAGGMVAGLALMVRYLAGGRFELDEAAPVDAGALIGLGLLTAALAGLGPTLFGGSVLQTADVYVPVLGLGELHLVSSVGFDIGVYLVVVGLALDLLRTFGSELDRHSLADQESREAGHPEETDGQSDQPEARRRGSDEPSPAGGPGRRVENRPEPQGGGGR